MGCEMVVIKFCDKFELNYLSPTHTHWHCLLTNKIFPCLACILCYSGDNITLILYRDPLDQYFTVDFYFLFINSYKIQQSTYI